MQHRLPIGGRYEFAPLVEQFERIPLAPIVASRYDDAPLRLEVGYSHLYRGRGGQPDVQHLYPASLQRCRYGLAHHLPGYPRIPTDYHFGRATTAPSPEPKGVGAGKPNDSYGI